MNKLTVTTHDALTSETQVREMTDDEYAALLETGWTPGEEPTDD